MDELTQEHGSHDTEGPSGGPESVTESGPQRNRGFLILGGVLGSAALVAAIAAVLGGGSSANAACVSAFNKLGVRGTWDLSFKLKSLGEASGKATSTPEYLDQVKVSIGTVQDYRDKCLLTWVAPAPKSAEEALRGSGVVLAQQGSQYTYSKDGTGALEMGATASVGDLPVGVKSYNATLAVDDNGDLILKEGTGEDTGSREPNVDPTGQSDTSAQLGDAPAGGGGSAEDASGSSRQSSADSWTKCQPSTVSSLSVNGIGCAEAERLARGFRSWWQSRGKPDVYAESVDYEGWACQGLESSVGCWQGDQASSSPGFSFS